MTLNKKRKENLPELIVKILDDGKANNILIINLINNTYLIGL